MNKPIRVLVIDDSAVVRQVMSDLLGDEPDIRVIGTAPDPLFAMQRMQKEWPDVITLDVEMPRMDGITFLKQVMAERPTPVVMCSSLTEAGAATTAQALAAGAVSVIAKPTLGVRAFLEDSAHDVASAVRSAARSNLRALAATASARAPKPFTNGSLPLFDGLAMAQTTDRVVAIGTSTGGTMALERLLSELPRVAPGIVIVQHMPEKFTASFAERLNSVCEVEVLEAQDGMRVIPGRVLIAPGGRHMTLRRNGAQYQATVRDGPPINRHRPSVDVLFRSVAKCAGANAIGVIMTGMGDDGACGLKEMHDAGARTLAQDEATSVVYGMPREAVKLGAVDRSLPLDALAGAILSECARRNA